MRPTRREFGALLGAAVAAPALGTGAVRTTAEKQEVQQPAGTVSPEAALAMLDVQGERGIYADPKNLDELRVSIARKLREHKSLRSIPMSDDVQPLLAFKR